MTNNGWSRGVEKLQRQWNENPVQLIFVGSLAATAASKLLNAVSSYKGRRTWDREVARRERQHRR